MSPLGGLTDLGMSASMRIFFYLQASYPKVLLRNLDLFLLAFTPLNLLVPRVASDFPIFPCPLARPLHKLPPSQNPIPCLLWTSLLIPPNFLAQNQPFLPRLSWTVLFQSLHYLLHLHQLNHYPMHIQWIPCLLALTSLPVLVSFFYENTCPAASALVRAPGIPCFWLRSLFTFLHSPLKTTNSQTLLERHGTTAIPRQIYLPTRERTQEWLPPITTRPEDCFDFPRRYLPSSGL